MKRFIKFSVQKAITIFMVVIAVSIFGIVSFTRLTTDLFPNINIPYALVITTYPGASHEEVESEVSIPLETQFQTTTNVIEVTSMSSENVSMIMLEFSPSANMETALSEMTRDLSMVEDSLPDGAGKPIILALNPDMLPVMTFSITYEGMSLQELTDWVENDIRPQVERVAGVANMQISGGYNAEIRVMLNQEAIDDFNESLPSMLDFEIDKAYIGDILMGQDFSYPSGFVNVGGISYLVRVGDSLEDMDALKSLKLFDMAGYTLTLDDVADIEFSPANEQTYSKVNAENALTITIQKGSEYATTDVTNGVNRVLNNLVEDDVNINVTMLLDQGEYIEQSTGSVTNNMILGGVLALVVLLVFLRNLRVTFIVGVAIPISLLFAIVLIYLSGITLNIVSLGGLALGIGMLVDNSIVVMENIFRMKREGASNKKAALYGTHQVGGAITASTLTTIGVFLPVMFIEDFIREIFYQLALTVSFSLIASLFIALTLVPALASKVLNEDETSKEHKETIFDKLKVWYETALSAMFKFRGFILAGVLALFVVVSVLATSRGFEFFPESDEGTLSISVEMHSDEPLDFSAFSDTLDQLYDDLRTYEDIESIGISLGGGMFMMGTPSADRANINIVLRDDREMSTEAMRNEIIDLLDTDYDQLVFEVSGTQGDVAMLTGSGIQVRLYGLDLEVLRQEALEIQAILETVDGVRDVDPGFGRESREVKITVDKEVVVNYISLVSDTPRPLTVEDVWMMVAGQIAGPQSIGEVRFDGQMYSVYLYEEGDEKTTSFPSVEALDLLVVGYDPMTDSFVTVGDVADVRVQPGFSTITRIDGARSITISAEVASGYNATLVAQDVEEAMEAYTLPSGYEFEYLGENEEVMAAIETLILMAVLAIAIVYMVMASQFQSLIYPFIIMITIPLAFTGGFFILYVFGMPVSIVAMLGLIVLSGVVVNNGIVLVDYINQLRIRGMELKDAIIEAGKVRMRPIFMTALTTILAMSGMAIGFGEGAELMQPMALTAIGGLIYATFLTIFIVPLLYYSVTLRGRYVFGGFFAVASFAASAFFLLEAYYLYGMLALVSGLVFLGLMLFTPKRPLNLALTLGDESWDDGVVPGSEYDES